MYGQLDMENVMIQCHNWEVSREVEPILLRWHELHRRMVRTMGVVLRDNMNEPGLGKDGLKLSEMFGKDGKKHENRNLQILSKILTGRRSTAVLS